ncbi:VOC family protein [Streptomyces sp. A7024]|uniref:VOC family protein n=1 Tax=Streptomyces coryli TaxID=1128680 RepID=A0A6G4UCT4_9ACTN|nr:VOC family protein [Streptomyces coryli]NGN69188.1 VOC family protein [Streptomyces coryli]
MTSATEGTPIWADATYPDLDKAREFYGDLFGWTFQSAGEEYGNYTQAFTADGQAAAALAPPMPGGEDEPTGWTLHLATPDAAATAAKIKANGGQVQMEPMQVGPFGTMALATDPTGVAFGLWQADQHVGFPPPGEQPQPGAFCWAEVNTSDAAKTDAFFPAVFGYSAQKMAGEEMDYAVWSVPGQDMPAMGRMATAGSDMPADALPPLNICFAVADADAAVATVRKHGGQVVWGPEDSPFGRLATVKEPQGAVFTVIDVTKTEGEMPEFA